MSDTLEGKIVRLAHEHPEHRDELLGLLRKQARSQTPLDKAALKILKDAFVNALDETNIPYDGFALWITEGIRLGQGPMQSAALLFDELASTLKNDSHSRKKIEKLMRDNWELFGGEGY